MMLVRWDLEVGTLCIPAYILHHTSLGLTQATLTCLQVMASPGVLALFASQRKNSILVSLTFSTFFLSLT